MLYFLSFMVRNISVICIFEEKKMGSFARGLAIARFAVYIDLIRQWFENFYLTRHETAASMDQCRQQNAALRDQCRQQTTGSPNHQLKRTKIVNILVVK